MKSGWWCGAALAAACAAAVVPGAPAEAPAQEPGQAPRQAQDPAQAALVARFAEQGIQVDLAAKTIELEARISNLRDPLEYLLVLQPQGKDYESLLACTGIPAEALNAAMLLLGVEKGQNGRVVPVEPAPSLEEIQNGADPYVVEPASGDGFYVYVSWEEEIGGQAEPFFYRAEDLVINARDEGTYQRGKFVYLGSRFVKPHKDAQEFFAAQGEGNLISLCIFEPANHLLAGGDPDSDNQDAWYSNIFLLPPMGHPVKVIFARERLDPASR